MAIDDAHTNDLEQALRTTGAVREFRDEPVPRATVRRVLDVARFAPSGGNKQPWRVVLVEDPEIRARLGELTASAAKEYLALMRAGQRPFGLTESGRWPGPGDVDLAAARAGDTDWPAIEGLRRAPVLLAVVVELGLLAALDAELDRHGLVAGASIYPFCRDLLLAARLEGLGGVLTTFAVRHEPQVLDLLGAPDGHALAAVVALGRPVRQRSKLTRRPVEEFATVDRFDGPAL
jgi:nitroreductase